MFYYFSRTYRDLYYVGVDLKENGLSPDQLKKLEEMGYQTGGLLLGGYENRELNKDVNTSLVEPSLSSTILVKEEHREVVNKNIQTDRGKKRGRPKKNTGLPVLKDESND